MSKPTTSAKFLKEHGIWPIRMGVLDTTQDWHLSCRIRSPDGFGPELVMPFEDLTDPRRTDAFLARNGLRLGADPQIKKKILEELRDITITDRCLFTEKLGWHDDEYLLEDLSIGVAGKIPAVYMGASDASLTSGTLEEWQQHVAEPAQASTIATLLICTALAPVLQRFTDVENGFFHISGKSGVGKTTMAKVATSVWRGGTGSVESWNMTPTAIEEMMLKRNDSFVCLDEITVGAESGTKLRTLMKQVSYKGTGGKTKTRARSYDGGGSHTFRYIGMSTGELTASVIASEARDTRMQGEEARFLDIPIPESPTGAFDKLVNIELADAASDASKVADGLNAAVEKYYGAASHAFLKAVVDDIDHAASKTAEYMKYFLSKSDQSKSGLEQRIAKKFALSYAAGRLGVEYGILPWKRSTTSKAIHTSYKICRKKLVTEDDEIGAAWAKLKPLFKQKNLERLESSKPKHAGTFHDYKGKKCAYIPAATLNSLIPDKRIRQALLTKLRDQGLYNAPANFPRSFGQQIKLPGGEKKQYYAIFNRGIKGFELPLSDA